MPENVVKPGIVGSAPLLLWRNFQTVDNNGWRRIEE